MLGWIDAALRETLLFASVGFLIGGVDDLAIDLIWIVRSRWRRWGPRRHIPPASLATLPPPRRPGRIAVLIAAWDEQGVIGPMLEQALARIDHPDYRLYVATYPNDPGTTAEVAAIAKRDARVRPVVGPDPGPTTKGANLNHGWAALLADEATSGVRFKAVAIHDAEDVIHSVELRLYDLMIERFDAVQIPVLPLVDPRSRWIGGHYLDEFAEAHHRQLSVREMLGAGVPLAGVGCALSRRALDSIARHNRGRPFDPDSVTEDYELGLRLAELGHRCAFVRLPAYPGAQPVMVRALFPHRIGPAVRQKARWLLGIALAGWDRLGWHGGWAERWMRLRDRRAPLSALLLFTAYASLLLWLASTIGHRAAASPIPAPSPTLALLLDLDLALLLWRGAMRWRAVHHSYGRSEAWRALARLPVSNAIAILAARKALPQYLLHLAGEAPRWSKTRHDFPAEIPAE